MIESAVDFVLSKINLYVGDRSKSVTVDVKYEMPKQAVTEAIVNAIAHRDYTSNASVQVILFADRLEVWNPGSLPYELTIDELYAAHRSIPANPLIAEAMYLRGTIERMGTGTEELANLCLEKGLKKPKFIQEGGFRTVLYRTVIPQATEQATEQVTRLLLVLDADINATTANLMAKLHLKHRPTFIYSYIKPALEQGFIELEHPNSPNHPQQKYRLTKKGKSVRVSINSPPPRRIARKGEVAFFP